MRRVVINDRAIVGWDALLKQQRQWWNSGKTDVKYELMGEPDFRMPAPGLVMVTYFLTSHRTLSGGQTSDSGYRHSGRSGLRVGGLFTLTSR